LSARAEEIEGALLAVQNDDHPNAVEMFDGLVWIARQRGRSLDEKLLAIGKLINHPGGSDFTSQIDGLVKMSVVYTELPTLRAQLLALEMNRQVSVAGADPGTTWPR
jgi:hypothetical protein